MNYIIKSHKINFKHLRLCFLDVSKAFDYVSYYAIKSLARRVNILKDMIDYIGNLYNGNSTRIKIHFSDEIRICRGNKQGRVSLSPLLFNFVMDYYVDGLIEEDAIIIDSLAVTHLAFTDDIVVFSDTTEGLQR